MTYHMSEKYIWVVCSFGQYICVNRRGHWWARLKAAMANKQTAGVFFAVIKFLWPFGVYVQPGEMKLVLWRHWCMWSSGASGDHREPISLHQTVHLLHTDYRIRADLHVEGCADIRQHYLPFHSYLHLPECALGGGGMLIEDFLPFSGVHRQASPSPLRHRFFFSFSFFAFFLVFLSSPFFFSLLFPANTKWTISHRQTYTQLQKTVRFGFKYTSKFTNLITSFWSALQWLHFKLEQNLIIFAKDERTMFPFCVKRA